MGLRNIFIVVRAMPATHTTAKPFVTVVFLGEHDIAIVIDVVIYSFNKIRSLHILLRTPAIPYPFLCRTKFRVRKTLNNEYVCFLRYQGPRSGF